MTETLVKISGTVGQYLLQFALGVVEARTETKPCSWFASKNEHKHQPVVLNQTIPVPCAVPSAIPRSGTVPRLLEAKFFLNRV
jgi:hypothetical protein